MTTRREETPTLRGVLGNAGGGGDQSIDNNSVNVASNENKTILQVTDQDQVAVV